MGITCGGDWWAPETFVEVERLGYDSLWTGEHIIFHRPILDSVPVLAGMAAITERVDIGPAAIMVPLRHPTILAKELASVDVMAGGRLIVTAGAGGDFRKEFEACGVDRRQRDRLTTEAIEIMRLYWTEERFSYHGEHFQLDDVWMDPKPPTPGGPRIWLAGRSRAAVERAVRVGDGYMPYMFTPQHCVEALRDLRETSERLEHPLRPGFTLAVFVYVSLHDDERYARQLAVEDLSWRYNQPFDRLVDRYCAFGNAERVLASLEEFVAAGATHFVLAPVHEAGREAEAVRRYADELLPRLRTLQPVAVA